MSITQVDGMAYSRKLRDMQNRDSNDNLVETSRVANMHASTRTRLVTAASDAADRPPPFDAACDPAHPKTVLFQDVSAAAYKIKGGIVRTPCTVGCM
jgi:hypothetical protein